jgi:hypothetical protein
MPVSEQGTSVMRKKRLGVEGRVSKSRRGEGLTNFRVVFVFAHAVLESF